MLFRLSLKIFRSLKVFLLPIKNGNFFKDYGTEDRNHAYIKVPIQEFIEFLTEFKFQNMPDAARKQATLRYVNI